MSHRGAENMLLTFQDVVACFSQKEWELLHKWQNDLYENLMKEIYHVLMSLGPLIAGSVFSLRGKEKDGLCLVEDEYSNRRHSDNHSPSVTMSALDMFNINRNNMKCLEDPQDTDRRKSPAPLATHRRESPDNLSLGPKNYSQGDPVFAPRPAQTFTDDSKRLFHPETEDVQVNTGMAVITSPRLPNVKEEAEAIFVDQLNSKIEGSINHLGDPVAKQSFTDDSKSLYHSETEDVEESTGMTIIECVLSSDIKEEAETSFADQLNSKIEGRITHLGDPVATSGSSQTFTDDHKEFVQQATEDEQGNTVRHRMSVAESTSGGYLPSSEISIDGENRCPTKRTPKKRKSSQERSGQAIKSRKLDGAAKYKTKFQPAWSKEYPVCGVNNDPFSYKCLACLKIMKCEHQGVRDIQLHCSTKGHRKRVNAVTSQQTLQFGVSAAASDIDRKVKAAQCLVQHNLPHSTADHIGPLLKSIFPDSAIAKKYTSVQTKATYILNGAMGPECNN